MDKIQEPLDAAAFRRPPMQFRGVPFFAWNCKLDRALLLREIDCFREMGFGGFCIHVRTGLATPYMGTEFMATVRQCEVYGKERGMRTWLYDEDRWPSGAAGGQVTKNPELRSRHLLFTRVPYGGDTSALPPLPYSRAGNARTENGKLMCRYDISFLPDGTLRSAKKLAPEETAQGTAWYAYLETQAPEAWYNNQTYIDVLNPKATEAFLAKTHELYKKLLGAEFGAAVPAIFCDEPQTPRRLCLPESFAFADVTLPWTERLAQLYEQEYSANLWDDLPLLLWDLPRGGSAPARWRWHKLLTDCFEIGFLKPYGDWCGKNHLGFTGHLMEEPTLQSQTAATGDAMRCYESFTLPGIDMLCGNFEFTTVKQCASVKNQMGRSGMLSETYGVTGWDFDFRSHKLHGDWQAALGVTQRVLHLAWAGMAGESKRDYPATLNYQSPWYREYGGVETHFARVAEALTRGRPIVHLAVLHPIESFWLAYGSAASTSLRREQLDSDFQNLTKWLLFGGVDFDFISEALLPKLCQKSGAPLAVGQMQYDMVLVPNCETLRSTTLEILRAFQTAGGRLVFLGTVPKRVDAELSAAPAALAEKCEILPLNRQCVLEAAEPLREVSLRGADGRLTENLLCQLRQDGEVRWLFLAHGAEPPCRDVVESQEVTVTLRGRWSVQCWDTMSGEISTLPVRYLPQNKTRLHWKAYAYDSLLLRLTPAQQGDDAASAAESTKQTTLGTEIPISEQVTVHLPEPNAMLLDFAEFALDGEPYRKKQEILRIDNILRKELRLPQRTDSVAQPWTVQAKPPVHKLRLRFAVQSDVRVENIRLTLEQPENVRLFCNGQEIPVHVNGWWVDHAIHTVPLPVLEPGRTVLEAELPFGEQTNLEWLYLLGDFGVRAVGAKAVLTAPIHSLTFGDIVPQGLPFYGGNLEYEIPFTLPQAGRVTAQAAHYRGHLMTFSLDGSVPQQVFLPPYAWHSSHLKAGSHVLRITLFGNRFNQFGPLHLFDSSWKYMGPGSWRSQGGQWSDEWQFRRTGILSRPVLTFFAE